MVVMQMKLVLILATVVIGLATVGCRQEPPTSANSGTGPGDKLTYPEGKTQNGPENGPTGPATSDK